MDADAAQELKERLNRKIDFLQETLYNIRDSRMLDQDIRKYIRERLTQFEGGYY